MMYRAFGEAKMMLNLYDFRESKKRKDVLQPLFSRKAVVEMQYLVKQNVCLVSHRALCWSDC